jgi:hypothetical protein
MITVGEDAAMRGWENDQQCGKCRVSENPVSYHATAGFLGFAKKYALTIKILKGVLVLSGMP